MSEDNQNVLLIGIVLALLLWKRTTSVDVGLTYPQICVYPDGTYIEVNEGDECPYDSDHGGASVPYTEPVG